MGLIFDENVARIYDSWYQSEGMAIDRSLEQLIMSLLKPQPGERVLDIGCGTGNHLLIFNRLGLDVTGIDASPHMINRAKERLGQRSTLKTGLAEDLPFEDNQFDLAVFINTLEFLDNPLQALREAGRVANRKVFIGVMNILSWNGLVKRIQGYLGNSLFSGTKFFSLWELKSLLQMAYGQVPITWDCIQGRPNHKKGALFKGKNSWPWKPSPFGFFLGVSATMLYRMKADNLPIKVRLKEAGQSLVGAKTIEDVYRSRGNKPDERGLSI